MEKTLNKKKNGVAGEELQRYNEHGVPAPIPTLKNFRTEDQALEYLAEILVSAYLQEKIL